MDFRSPPPFWAFGALPPLGAPPFGAPPPLDADFLSSFLPSSFAIPKTQSELLVADRLSLSRTRNGIIALHADAFLGAVVVDAAADPGRLSRLRVEQHDVRVVDRGGHLHDLALLLRATRLAMALHDVD